MNRKKWLPVLSVALLCASLVACGGKSSGTPTVATPVVVATPVPPATVAGTWSGTYVISNCGHTGLFAAIDWCGQLSGVALPMQLTLNQTGSALSGTLAQGSIGSSVTGTVDGNGNIALTGSGTSGTITFTTFGWNTLARGGVMTGSWTTKWTATGLADFAQATNTLSAVVKSAAANPPAIVAVKTGDSIRDFLNALR